MRVVECPYCNSSYHTLFTVDSDTQALCPYCCITTLEAQLADKKAALEAQAEEHLCTRKKDDADWGDRFIALSKEHAKDLAEARGDGEPAERLEYIARDLARLLLVSARDDITEFRMNRSTYAWLVERANA